MEVYVIYFRNLDIVGEQGYVGGDSPKYFQESPYKFYNLKQAKRIVKTYENQKERGVFRDENLTWDIHKLGVVATTCK